jgi:hypothetical protein
MQFLELPVGDIAYFILRLVLSDQPGRGLRSRPDDDGSGQQPPRADAVDRTPAGNCAKA